MNSLRNSVRLIGNLGSDPEIKEFPSGSKMAKFSLATSDVYKNDKGEKVSETQWHNLVVWGKQSETAGKYLKKGSEIAIEGKLITRSYNDKEGVKKYMTEIVVNEFTMLGPKSA